MRYSLWIIIWLIVIVSGAMAENEVTSPPTYEIGDAIPGTRVAVMNLNVSGEYRDQVRDWLPVLIEDKLLGEGWTLVVRGERMQHIQEERNLPGIKPETRLPDQELLGATAFLELTARVQVKSIQGLVGYKIFTLGDYARATIDLNGQIVDPATGVLKSSVSVGGSASGLKTGLVLTVGSDWRIGAGGYEIQDIQQTLVGKAADEAAARLLERLKALYPTLPKQRSTRALQPSSTTVTAESTETTILITLPDDSAARPGDHYGVFRDQELIAEVELIAVTGKRAQAKILSQSAPIQPTDRARPMPVVITAE